MEVKDTDLAYTDLKFEISSEKEEEMVTFYVNSKDPSLRIQCPVNSFSHYAMSEIIMNGNKDFQDFNIISLYDIINGTKIRVHSMFLTYFMDRPVIRMTLYEGKEDFPDSLIIKNYDIATGVCLSHLLKHPIAMLQKEFEARRIK